MAGFQKATKKQAKLRLAIFGPSGAGKTFTALRLANGIGGKIAFIDSETGSASKYADRFEFDVCELADKSIDQYIHWINEAGKLGYNVLIIDSITHAWQQLLEEIDQLAKAKYKGNSWSAWSEGTPKQKRLVDAMLSFKGHLIATMRSKTEWTIDQSGGKNKPTRVGLSPEQGKGIEFEFDLLMEISTEHIANIIKDRTGKFQDVLITKPGEEFGKELYSWLSDGAAAVGQQQAEKKPQDNTVDATRSKYMHTLGVQVYGDNWDNKRAELCLAITKKRTNSSKELKAEELEQLISGLEKKKKQQDQAAVEALKKQEAAAAKRSAKNETAGTNGAVSIQMNIAEELKHKLSGIDNGIDFTQFMQKEEKMIELVTDKDISADLMAFIASRAAELGISLEDKAA